MNDGFYSDLYPFFSRQTTKRTEQAPRATRTRSRTRTIDRGASWSQLSGV